MRPSTNLPEAVKLQLEAAESLGMEFAILDEDYGYLFELRKGDRRRIFVGGRSSLNDAVAARICEDKHYTGVVLSRAGYRVPKTVRCLSPEFCARTGLAGGGGTGAGIDFAHAHGFPVIVKPNRLSHGRGVAMARSADALNRQAEAIWLQDDIALVQEPIQGEDVRLDFLDGEYLAGYVRRPVSITGDGCLTVHQLLTALDPRFANRGGHRFGPSDSAWQQAVVQRGYGSDSVLPKGVALDFSPDVLNLNGWALAEPVAELPQAWKQFCLGIGRCIGLRHFGVDLRGAGLSADPAEVCVIEVNASPLLVQLYELGHRRAALEAQCKVLSAVFQSRNHEH